MAPSPINQSGPINPLSARAPDAAKKRDGGKNDAEKADGVAREGNYDVNISQSAKQKSLAMRKALDIARTAPEVREDRVADLRAQIKAGTYKPDAGKIADGMLREAIREHLAINEDR